MGDVNQQLQEIPMADRPDARDPEMDASALYREEIITDRRVGTIRMLTPITADGRDDAKRQKLFVGEAQMLTSVGPLPISFDIEAATLADAVAKYGAAAKEGFERAVRELQDLRRQQASSIVLPPPGAAGAFGPGGGGKIQMP
jgi:hypothetical protein